jgi:pilus assembly protein CpaE
VHVLPPGRLPADPARLFEQLPDGELPDVLLIGPLAPPEEVFTLAARLDVQCPGISVVLLADPTPGTWQAAMRAGIRDLLPATADAVEVRAAVERAGSTAAGRRRVLRPVEETARYTGRVITVASPKGGVGKTTVSANLAIGLTAAAPQSTVLVDLDVQFGDVASALGLVPEYALPDVAHGPATEDTMVLKTFLTQHPSGLYAVCGAESPAAGDTVTAADVGRLLTSLSREFRYVVVDTAPGLSEQTLAALDRATDVVMLSSMDVPGVRGLRKELDVLRELCMIPAGRHVVMNFADAKGGLSVRDVETAIGTGVDVVLPRSAAVPASTNQGVPILATGRRDPVVKEMRRLVSRFAATPLMKPGRYRAKHRAAS